MSAFNLVDKVHIDADIFRYEIGYLKDEDGNPIGEKVAIKILQDRINTIKEGSKCRLYKTYLSCGGNFRDELATLHKYKGNREGTERPALYDFLTGVIAEEFNTELVYGMEADDALSIQCYSDYKEGIPSVLSSRDKDLRMVPGLHYVWACGRQKEQKLHLITEEEAMRWFYTQLLMGDKTVDNIWGLSGTKEKPGIGPKKAEKMLIDASTETEWLSICRAAYKDKFGEVYEYTAWTGETMCRTYEGIMRENAGLLWMQRYEGEVWEPLRYD